MKEGIVFICEDAQRKKKTGEDDYKEANQQRNVEKEISVLSPSEKDISREEKGISEAEQEEENKKEDYKKDLEEDLVGDFLAERPQDAIPSGYE